MKPPYNQNVHVDESDVVELKMLRDWLQEKAGSYRRTTDSDRNYRHWREVIERILKQLET